MIIIRADNITVAVKKAFWDLYRGTSNGSDPTIFREDAAVIEVLDASPKEPTFELRRERLHYVGDYAKYVPSAPKDLPAIEEKHFTDIFIKTGKIESIVAHLTRHPATRRGLLSTWSSEYVQYPDQDGVCITQLYFRLRAGNLELHSHSRANDAWQLLLMDMQLSTWVQNYVAGLLGVPTGRYIHFVDSLQLYEKHRSKIDEQYEYVRSSPVWQ